MTDQRDDSYYTIPKFAARIGVTPSSVRAWIRKGWVEPPTDHPVTGEALYTTAQADAIECWYMKKAAAGDTRGPGADERRRRAQRWLMIHVEPSR